MMNTLLYMVAAGFLGIFAGIGVGIGYALFKHLTTRYEKELDLSI